MRAVPFSVWRLMFAYSLMMGGTAMTVMIGGIVGYRFAPSEGLATLPIALAVIGLASSTLPVGRLQARLGRRTVFLAYGGLAVSSALLAAYALVIESFAVYCASTFLMGWAAAAGHQYRFAAIDLVPARQAPQATSALLLGGILGAFIGPEMAVRGRFLLETEYAGSYLLLVIGYILGVLIVSFYRERPVEYDDDHLGGRPLREILADPLILLAIASAAVAYGLMSFLMTATPISMHDHSGLSLEATKWVIQSHIAGMYVPSLFFAALLARFGYKVMLWAGVVAYAVAMAIALQGVALVNYWVSLALLGVGWNFLFLSGTNLLHLGHRRSERFKVQSFNDFLIFSIQALVSLGSGWFLFHFAWNGLVMSGVVMVMGFVVYLAFFMLSGRYTLPSARS